MPTEHDLPEIVVVGAKLRRPVLPRHCLPRVDLLALLDEWRTTRLIAITGAAGYGKSTLALLFLQQIEEIEVDAKSAWLALDEDDDDPMHFTGAVIAALGPLAPEGARQANLALHQRQPRQALLLLLAALDAVPTPIFFVLDDVHRIQSADVHALLQLLLERAAQSLHLVMLSRRSLPLALSRWSLRDEVVEVDEQSLRLTHAETAAFVALEGSVLLDDATIAQLVEGAEGWVAGVQLMLLSLRRHALAAQDPRSLMRGDNVVLAQYLTNEVLVQQDAAMREFLLECAILERLHAGLCNAVTGNPHSAHLLDRAMNERLFLRALDAHGEWYELHHLFREMLLRELEKQRTYVQIDTLHLAAAQWYGEQGQVAQAVKHFLAGHAPERAADFVERHARPALLQNRWLDLMHWINLLPEQQVDSHPQLLLDRAWWLGWNDLPMAPVIARAEQAMQRLDVIPGAWRDELTMLRLFQRTQNCENTGVHADALAAIPHMDPQSHLARGWAWLAAASIDGRRPDPERIVYAERAVAELAIAQCEIGEPTALFALANIARLNADPAMLDACQRAFQIMDAQRRPNPSDEAGLALIAGEFCFWQDRIEEAETYFTRAFHSARIVAEEHYISSAHQALQLCAVVRTGAAKGLGSNDAEALPRLGPQLLPVAKAKHANATYWQMLRWLVLDRPLDAWRTFESRAIDINTLTVNSPLMLWLVVLTAFVTRGDAAHSIEKPVESLLGYYGQGRYQYVMIQLRLLLARYYQQQGRPNQARALLRDALHDVEQTGLIRTVLIHRPLKPLLSSEHTPFAQSLVQKMDEVDALSPLARLSGQENRIFALLVQGYGIGDIAEQLVVSPATVKWHLGNIYGKLGVKGRRQALQFARGMG